MMTGITLIVAFDLDAAARRTATEALGGVGQLICLCDVGADGRATALRDAGAVLAWNLKDFSADDLALLGGTKLIQFMTAGVDFIPLSTLPPGVPVASNGGAYAEPMAEHALALALAAAKRIIVEHNNVAAGIFNQHRNNRMLGGGVCAILGFGGIGVATARIMRGIGMQTFGINRSGTPHDLLDWVGTPDRLDEMLAAADVLIISVPLTKATTGMIGARELNLMKPNAILINLARGEIVDEAGLFAYLQAQPKFTACIDAWWVEPVRHGTFRMDHPFTSLPNVVASPHNSASVAAYRTVALRRAAENCRRALQGETVHYLVRPEDRLL